MPYIVTTKRRYHEGANRADGSPYLTVSRRAVATLEEARWFAQNPGWRYGVSDGYTAAEGEDAAKVLRAARSLPESGGTVGPLPDGTVIEVEQSTWFKVGDALYGAEPATRIAWAVQHADQGQPDSTRWLIDAFNTRHGS